MCLTYKKRKKKTCVKQEAHFFHIFVRYALAFHEVDNHGGHAVHRLGYIIRQPKMHAVRTRLVAHVVQRVGQLVGTRTLQSKADGLAPRSVEQRALRTNHEARTRGVPKQRIANDSRLLFRGVPRGSKITRLVEQGAELHGDDEDGPFRVSPDELTGQALQSGKQPR